MDVRKVIITKGKNDGKHYRVTVISNGVPTVTDVNGGTFAVVKRLAIQWLNEALESAHGRGDHVVVINELSYECWDWVVGEELFRL
jgi:hypothetical protein